MIQEKRQKYGGRKKGTPNKDTKKLRERISDLIDNNFDTIQADIDQLEPKERLDFLVKLFEYGLPKLQRITHEGNKDNVTLVFESHAPKTLDDWYNANRSEKAKG